jgi:hypothetical protein
MSLEVIDAAYAGATLPRLWPGAPAHRPVSLAEWEGRRVEIVGSLADALYGRTPGGGGLAAVSLISEQDALGGIAIRREYELTVEGPRGSHRFDLVVHLPRAPRAPIPVFLGLNFDGNPATTTEPGLRSRIAHRAEALTEPGPTPRALRVLNWCVVDATGPVGSDIAMWPLERIVRRGYALATAHNAQLEEDRPEDRAPGIGGLFDASEEWGVIGKWAWGMSRALDALHGMPDLDPSAVIAIGHSRLGKAALWAAAQDVRFRGVVSNDSGCAGASLFRHQAGEGLDSMTNVFPHWLLPSAARYAGHEEDLPVDQHLLLAAVAPGGVHVASAADDEWADPRGEFLASVHASPIFTALGMGGVSPRATSPGGGLDVAPADALGVPGPAAGESAGAGISYHLRRGRHAMVAEDWGHALDFADRLFNSTTRAWSPPAN